MSVETEDIKNRLNIVDIVGEYVRLTKAGANYKGLCPFHNEKSPSFMVNEEKQIFHCFGCSKGGDIYGFLMEIEGVDFREALKVLAEKAGVKLTNTYTKQKDSDVPDRSLEILELATKFYQKQLLDGEGRKKALPYLQERGLSLESMQTFRLGYVPEGWNAIENFLTGRGYTRQEIEKTGLLVQKEGVSRFYDRFRNRILFPITDILGRVIGYSARALPGDNESQAKYINTPETHVYHKSKVLYGISQAKQSIKRSNEVLIVEGNMDVIAMHQVGFQNVVAVSGTALTQQHIQILKRYTKNLTLFFDMDEAGQEAAKKSAILGFQNELNISIVSITQEKDAADLVQTNPEALKESVQKKKSAMEYFLQALIATHDINKPEEKKNLVLEALQLVHAFRNEVEKDAWIKKIADSVQSSIESVLSVYKQLESSEKKWNQAPDKQKDVLEAPVQSRINILCDQISGTMLVSENLWKMGMDFLKKYTEKEKGYIEMHTLLRSVESLGETCHFDFEEFRTMLESESLRAQAQQIFFRYKYEESSQGDMKEVSEEVLKDQLKGNFRELKREIVKERLNQLMHDIKKTEESGDKATKEMLSREFSQLSQELNI